MKLVKIATPMRSPASRCSSMPIDEASIAQADAKVREVQAKLELARARVGQNRELVSTGAGRTVAYRGEHRTVVEELGVIDTASRRKNCLTPPTWRSTTAIQ